MAGLLRIERDIRPSEFFYEYHEWAERFDHLYFCRNCIRNFDTEFRVKVCKYCEKSDIVELPNGQYYKRSQDSIFIKIREVAKRLKNALCRNNG